MLRSPRTMASKKHSLSWIMAERSARRSPGNGRDRVRGRAGRGSATIGRKSSPPRRELRIAQHPPDLGRQDFPLPQRFATGVVEQLLVGHTAPEEIGQPICQYEVFELSRGRFDAEKEMRRDQDRPHCRADALLDTLAFFLGQLRRFGVGASVRRA